MLTPHRLTERRTALTPRQLQIVKVTARLGSHKLAAFEMGISHQTLKNHLTSVYAKLEVGSLPEALYLLWLRDLWEEEPA